MTKRPSLRDVAQLAGVSTATVSHVINGTRYVEPQTAERVRAAIDQLHYVNNGWAKMLRSEKSDIIGMLINDLVNPYSISITNNALELVRARGYQLYITPISNDDPEANDRAIETLMSYRAAGVLAIPLNTAVIHRIHDQLRGIPMSCIEGDPSLTDTVDTNHLEATREAVALIAQSHTRIGFVRGAMAYPTSESRLQGYREAIDAASIPFQPRYVACGESSVKGGYEAARKLLSTDITALFVANDLMMQGALQAIAEVDSSLLSRLAIVGFDDQDWYSFYRPSITAIRQPLREMVSKAVDLLFQRIQQPDHPLEHHILPASLIRRESF